nr:ribonuclease H-like domain-containing protein [Tanacetum cinerariifolium]
MVNLLYSEAKDYNKDYKGGSETAAKMEVSHEKVVLSRKGSAERIDDNQGLNHVNFFNEIHIVEPDVPYDDRNDNASSQSDGSNHPHHNSPTINHNENDLGHFHGSNRSDSKDVMDATFEEQLSNSESINVNIPSLVGAKQTHQPLRRSDRVTTLPRRYNDFVMASKGKFGLEKFVTTLNLVLKTFVLQLS